MAFRGDTKECIINGRSGDAKLISLATNAYVDTNAYVCSRIRDATKLLMAFRGDTKECISNGGSGV